MSHLHVLTEHLVQTTQEGLVRRALVDLVDQWEETRSRHTRHTGAGGGECLEGYRATADGLGWGGCFVYGGLRRPPRVERGHVRASERGRRGSREGLWGPCPRQREQQRPKVSGPACWRAGPQEAGLAGVWRGEREGVGIDGA